MNNLSKKINIFFILSFFSVIELIHSYEIGTERTYLIENTVESIDLKTKENSLKYQLEGNLKVGSLWGDNDKKLIKFDLITPDIKILSKNNKKFKHHDSNLDKIALKSSSFYILLKNGKILKYYSDPTEDLSLRNLKKGLASLFQYQITDSVHYEDDISGHCQVIYNGKTSTQFIKIKNFCSVEKDNLNFFKRPEKPLGISQDTTRNTIYDITADGTIDKVESKEIFKIYLNTNKEIGSIFESILSLKSNGEIKNIDKTTFKTLDDAIKNFVGVKEDDLLSDTIIYEKEKETSLIKLIKDYKKNLGNDKIGKADMALTFIKLIEAAKQVDAADINRILNGRTTKDIKGQFLDLFAAVQKYESYKVIKEHLDFKNDKNIDMIERYFQAMAVTTRPNIEIISDLMTYLDEKFEEPKISDILLQTVCSMMKNYCHLPGQNYEHDLAKLVEQHILTHITRCEDVKCKTMFIRALQNLQSLRTIPILFDYIHNGDRTVSVAAAKAIRSFEIEHFTENNQKDFLNIFFQGQKRYDSTVRTIALDMIFAMKPDDHDLKMIIEFLKYDEKDYEIKQYLSQRIQMISDECSIFKERIEKIIKKDPKLNNYNIFAQKGLSTALSRKFTKSPLFNTTLVSIQEMSSGVLKTGVVNLNINSDNDHYSIFTLGMYSGGMSSFVGGDKSSDEDSTDNKDEEEEPPNAGMEITVQGSFLRPLVFFRGQGELMGHVWSGTASDPTPAYQATSLLQDHEENFRLQNGAIISVNILGSVSIDLNGKIKISIWNRNAHSVVEKNVAFATQGSINLKTSFIKLMNDFTLVQSPKLELVTDIDISSGPMLCMQLTQPNTLFNQTISQILEIPNTKYRSGKTVSFKYELPGNTFVLNQKNNEMCNLLLN